MTAPRHDRLTMAEATAHTGCSARTLRRYVSDGRLPAYRLGPRRLVFRVRTWTRCSSRCSPSAPQAIPGDAFGSRPTRPAEATSWASPRGAVGGQPFPSARPRLSATGGKTTGR